MSAPKGSLTMRIGKLAARTGVSARSLRYYEEQGLLSGARTEGGQRRYAEGDVERVRLVQSLYAVGLTSKAIYAILPCVDAPSPRTYDAGWELLARRREELDAHIAAAVGAREAIDRLVAENRRERRVL